MNDASRFLIDHGLTCIFVVCLVERIGLPVPAFPWLLAAGTLSASAKLNALPAAAMVVLGCVLGDSFWYYLGRRRGAQVLGWLCRISLEADSCVRRTQNFFTRFGLSGLLIAKFVPGLGTVAPPLAGMTGVGLGQFVVADSVGSLAYAACGIGLGYFFRNQISQIMAALTHIGSSALILLFVIGGLYIAYKYWQRKRLLHELRAARITAEELRRKLDDGEKPVVLDLRSRAELKLDPSIIRGAIHIDLDKMTDHVGQIPKDRDVIVYCSCPNEVSSARFALELQKQGFTRIRPLLGGIDAWRKLNYPTELWTSTVTVTAGSQPSIAVIKNKVGSIRNEG